MGKYIGATTAPVLKSNNHWMTQEFKKGTHNGIDLIKRGKINTPLPKTDDIIAIAEGEVTYTGYSSTRGYYVEMKHKNGYLSRYLHLKKGSICVKKGQYIQKGTKVGFMGSTGDSTANHLHLAVCKANGTFVDPLPYLLGSKNFDGKVEPNAYQVYDMKKKKWLPKVNVGEENMYAGIIGDNISGIYLDKGELRVHTKGGKWLPAVKDHNDYAGILTKKIDAVAVKGFKYRVHIKGGNWLPFVNGYNINDSNNGYAGILGKPIDAIQIKK
jgi:hypothetical protein